MCPGCGQPKDVVYNPDAEGWFEAQEITCAGCAATQQHNSTQKKATPGAKVFVVDTRPDDLELRPWRPGSVAGPDDDAGDDQADAEHAD